MSSQNILPEIQPLPHREIIRKHGLKLGQVAKYIDRSYPYTSNVLSGNYRPSAEMLNRLDQLVTKLEQAG